MHDNRSQSTVFKLGESGVEKGSPLARVVTLADGGFDHRASDDVRVAREMDARAWRKMDYAVLPVVTMIFFLSFLDKGNIGNARIAGLQKDLSISDYQYSLLLTITLIPYILVELPSNLWLKRIGPNIIIPAMTVLWGIATALQGVVANYRGLVACRIFLGLFEGGLLPGITLYLSTFYLKEKLQLRISLFFASTTLAGAFSGLLASAILHMDGVGGRPGWSWIFILEGLFTFVFGVLSFFILPRTPSHVALLSHDEKAHILAILDSDTHVAVNEMGAVNGTSTGSEYSTSIAASKEFNGSENSGAVNWEHIWMTLKAPHLWMFVAMGFFNGTTLSGLAYFTPSIVASLGYTANQAQLMSVPPFAVGFVLSIVSSYFSDRYAKRGLTIIVFAVMGIVGFAIFLGSHHPHVRYASLFFIIPSTYSTAPPLAAWTSNNAHLPSLLSSSSLPTPTPTSRHSDNDSSYTARATSIALLTISTNLGGILATWLLGSWSKAPEWTVAAWVLGAFQLGIGGLAAVCWASLRRRNGREGVRYVL